MSRAVAYAALAAFALAAALLGLGVATAPAAASQVPGPFCGVCAGSFDGNVTASNATLQMTEDGDIRWRVENQVDSQAAEAWREDPGAAERLAREGLHEGYVDLSNPTDLSVEVRGDTVVVEFVDRGAARQRLGLLVLPYFHGEGSDHRWTVNADELIVKAPDGHRIVNEPTRATVEEDRVDWNGSFSEPGDAYVVAGDGATADARWALVSPVVPLDPIRYGVYGVGALFVAGLVFGVYTIEGTRLGPRRVSAGVAAATVPYVLAAVAVHPIGGGGFAVLAFLFVGVLLALLLGLLGGAALHVAAARAEPNAGGGER